MKTSEPSGTKGELIAGDKNFHNCAEKFLKINY